MTRAPRLVALAVALPMAIAACSGGSTPLGPAAAPPREVDLGDVHLAAALSPFDSCDALLSWIKQEASTRVTAYGLNGGGVMGDVAYATAGGVAEDGAVRNQMKAAAPLASESSIDAPASTLAATGAGADFSTTNVQVEGVDEPDSVKTDGDHLYTITGNKLHVVDVSEPASPKSVGTLDLGQDAYGAQLLLSGDTLLVVNPQGYAMPLGALEDRAIGGPATDVFPANEPASTLTQVDVSDPAAPRVVARLALEGSYVSARMVGDVARVVVQSQPQAGIQFVYPAGPSPDAEATALAANRMVIEKSTIGDWLPSYRVTAADGRETDSGQLIACDAMSHPQTFSGFGALGVVTVDLGDGLAESIDPGANTGVMSGGETVYASAEHLYVATQQYVDWNALTPTQQSRFDADYGTAIHRFDISNPARATYEGSGTVEGHLLNQYAMDEHDGTLRVATTKGSPWMVEPGGVVLSPDGSDVAVPESTPASSESMVTNLQLRDGSLAAVGKVGGLGKNETIQSVRFIGDRGYVVTFRQMDPLFVIDLADPAHPALAGELEIPGYSAYLHPVGDGYLLGVGQDAGTDGFRTGSQVSLFDVRDAAHPTRVAHVPLGAGSSQVEFDPHAFLWWAKDQLAVIPVDGYGDCGAGADCAVPACPPGAKCASIAAATSSAVGLDVDVSKGTITERGRVVHPGSTVSGGPVPEPLPMPIEPGAGGSTEPSAGTTIPGDVGSAPPESYAYTAPITRSLVVGDTLYTLSETGLLASNLHTLAPGTFVPLPA